MRSLVQRLYNKFKFITAKTKEIKKFNFVTSKTIEVYARMSIAQLWSFNGKLTLIFQ